MGGEGLGGGGGGGGGNKTHVGQDCIVNSNASVKGGHIPVGGVKELTFVIAFWMGAST